MFTEESLANALYNAAKERCLTSGLGLASRDIKVCLVDTGTYTFNADHTTFSQVATAARIGPLVSLSGVTTTAGVFDASDAVFSGVSGTTIEALVIYASVAPDDTTSDLIAYFDSVSAGLPATPNGANITVEWDSGANRIFKLG